jgi:hypothetical protein
MSQTDNGCFECSSTEANRYTATELALMRTQDIGYLRTKSQSEARVRFTACGKPTLQEVITCLHGCRDSHAHPAEG